MLTHGPLHYYKAYVQSSSRFVHHQINVEGIKTNEMTFPTSDGCSSSPESLL